MNETLRQQIGEVLGLRDNYYGEITDEIMAVVQPEIERLDKQAELLAAALLTRGVEAKDCDALDQWLRSE